jgi:hypothetical protein
MGFKKEYIIFFIPTLLIKKRIHDEYKYLLLIKIRIENLRAFLSIPFFLFPSQKLLCKSEGVKSTLAFPIFLIAAGEVNWQLGGGRGEA